MEHNAVVFARVMKLSRLLIVGSNNLGAASKIDSQRDLLEK